MKVSIFTPSHGEKSEEYLKGAYASIKDQDFHEWIILFNHGAKEVRLEDEFNDSRIKTYISEKEYTDGFIGALKAAACDQATGDILLELDHDDLLMPTCIEEVKKAFEDPEVGFVYSNSLFANFYDRIKPEERFSGNLNWEFREIEYNGQIYDETIQFEPAPSSVSKIFFAPNHLRAFRKTVYDEIGGYDRELRILDDQDIMCRMYLATKFYHINKGLYIYRLHKGNTYKISDYQSEIQKNCMVIYRKYIQQMALKWAKDRNLRALDLGARFNATEGYESVDIKPPADILCDLEGPWPFEDNSVGVVRASDVLEHLKDPIHTMKELYRVLAPGAYAFINVPSTDGRGAFMDPTHKSFWNSNSFLYYTHRNFAKYIDTPVRFVSMAVFDTDFNEHLVRWVEAHLIKLDDNLRIPGPIDI